MLPEPGALSFLEPTVLKHLIDNLLEVAHIQS